MVKINHSNLSRIRFITKGMVFDNSAEFGAKEVGVVVIKT